LRSGLALQYHHPPLPLAVFGKANGNAASVDEASQGKEATSSLWKFGVGKKRGRDPPTKAEEHRIVTNDSYEQLMWGTTGGYQRSQEGGDRMKRVRID
jgi:hypothetical protein